MTPRSGTVLLCLVVGCTTGATAAPFARPTSTFTPDFASGTRLRAVVWEVDGIQMLDHFFDVQRSEPCAFVENGIAHVGAGPTYWCLPLNAATHDADGALGLYADFRCSEPLALAPITGNADYAITRPADACADRPTVTRTQPATSRQVYVLDGTCKNGTTAVVQRLGDVVPLDEFVSASEIPGDADGRIAPLVLVAADGARQTIGGFDRDRKIAVTAIDPGSTGDLRWFPARLAFEGTGSNFYSDGSCSTPVPTKAGRDAVCPLAADFAFAGTCGDGTYYELGAPTSAVFASAPQNCAPSTSAVHAFARGAGIPRSAFVPALAVERGGTRVRARSFSGGAAVTELVDVGTGETCAPAPAFDGTTRCLPAASADVSFFADEHCTAPAIEQPIGDCSRGAPAQFFRSNGHTYQVGATPTDLWQLGPKGCARHELTAGTRPLAVTEVPVSRFAKVTQKQL